MTCFSVNLLNNHICFQVILRCFKDLIRVPRIENQAPRIRENQVPKIREIRSLQVHTGYLTFSLKKPDASIVKVYRAVVE